MKKESKIRCKSILKLMVIGFVFLISILIFFSSFVYGLDTSPRKTVQVNAAITGQTCRQAGMCYCAGRDDSKKVDSGFCDMACFCQFSDCSPTFFPNSIDSGCGCASPCAGKQCGDNGCGGTCGTCPAGKTCNSAGLCICTITCTNGQKRCSGNYLQTCADYNSDGCYEWGGNSNCQYGCCTSEQAICNGNTLQLCINGCWRNTNCDYGCSSSGLACNECSASGGCAQRKHCGYSDTDKNNIIIENYYCDVSVNRCKSGPTTSQRCIDINPNTPFCGDVRTDTGQIVSGCAECLSNTDPTIDCTSKLKPPYCSDNSIKTPTSMICTPFGNCIVYTETTQPCTVDACNTGSCNPATVKCIQTPKTCNSASSDGCCPSGCSSNPSDGINFGYDVDCNKCLTKNCSDGNKCNGLETCNTATGVCQAGTPPDCNPSISDGCCSSECSPNHFLGTEDIDCKCSSNSQCSNDDFCDGAEICNPTTKICEAGTLPDCNDNKYCTYDDCNPLSGCSNNPVPMEDETCPLPTGLSSLSPWKSFWNSLLKMFGITGKVITGNAVAEQGVCKKGECVKPPICGDGKVDPNGADGIAGTADDEECDPGKHCSYDHEKTCTKPSDCMDEACSVIDTFSCSASCKKCSDNCNDKNDCTIDYCGNKCNSAPGIPISCQHINEPDESKCVLNPQDPQPKQGRCMKGTCQEIQKICCLCLYMDYDCNLITNETYCKVHNNEGIVTGCRWTGSPGHCESIFYEGCTSIFQKNGCYSKVNKIQKEHTDPTIVFSNENPKCDIINIFRSGHGDYGECITDAIIACTICARGICGIDTGCSTAQDTNTLNALIARIQASLVGDQMVILTAHQAVSSGFLNSWRTIYITHTSVKSDYISCSDLGMNGQCSEVGSGENAICTDSTGKLIIKKCCLDNNFYGGIWVTVSNCKEQCPKYKNVTGTCNGCDKSDFEKDCENYRNLCTKKHKGVFNLGDLTVDSAGYHKTWTCINSV